MRRRRQHRTYGAGSSRGFGKGFWVGCSLGISIGMAIVVVTPLVVLGVAATGGVLWIYRKALPGATVDRVTMEG